MDERTIVDPGANTKAGFQTDGQEKSLSVDRTDNPQRSPLRNFN
jgi:hypothetical protein